MDQWRSGGGGEILSLTTGQWFCAGEEEGGRGGGGRAERKRKSGRDERERNREKRADGDRERERGMEEGIKREGYKSGRRTRKFITLSSRTRRIYEW